MCHCPECKAVLLAPFSARITVDVVNLLMLYCPHCHCYLGCVTMPQPPSAVGR